VFITSYSINTFKSFIEVNHTKSLFFYQNNYSYLTEFHLVKPPIV
jgi:hypothetical protein